MTIITIQFKDPLNPHEVQAWFDANPTANVIAGFMQPNFVYVITNP